MAFGCRPRGWGRPIGGNIGNGGGTAAPKVANAAKPALPPGKFVSTNSRGSLRASAGNIELWAKAVFTLVSIGLQAFLHEAVVPVVNVVGMYAFC